MSAIFVVSPHYLEAIYNESTEFDFELVGYGNFNNAMNGLRYVNVNDILGFAYVADTLPKKIENLYKFLNTCNLICRYKKKLFLFCCHDQKGLKQLNLVDKYRNLEFKNVLDDDIITDVTIRRDIFGTILINNYQPYFFKGRPAKPALGTIPTLEYSFLFTKQTLSVLSSVNKLKDSKNTLYFDKVYSDLATNYPLLAHMRRRLILSMFSEDCSEEDRIIQEMIADVTDNSLYAMYRSLFYLLRKEKSIDFVK